METKFPPPEKNLFHKRQKARGLKFTRGVSMTAEEEAALAEIGLAEVGRPSVSKAIRFLLSQYRNKNGE